jgi:pimeloyl-ACP methyl ester carboxylesterase
VRIRLLLLALPLLLAGCGGTSSRSLELHPCTVGGSQAECGTLLVAENPNEPQGKQIPLAVAVVRALGKQPEPDPLFWFAGWGSAGVTDDAGGVISAFTRVNLARDIVFIDQRGTGSSKLECALAPDLRTAPPAAVTAAARRCAAKSGPNLRYYTSYVAVDDFDAVRRALGYDRINIYGGSYGVTTGQIYLLRHGDHVRSAVFDSGSLLDVHIFEQQLVNVPRTLDMLFARCAKDVACHRAFPRVEQEFAQIMARLERAPITVPGSEQRVDAAAFASLVDDLIAYTPGKVLVPRFVHLVATGQYAKAGALLPQDGGGKPDLAYQLLIQCSEPWASWRRDAIERLSPGSFLAPLFRPAATTMAAACAGFPSPDVPAAIGQRVHSDVPVLFLAGDEDGADPPANIADAERELPNSRTIVFTAAGHGQLGLYCAQTLIAEFVAAASAERLNPACAKTAALRQFDTRS